MKKISITVCAIAVFLLFHGLTSIAQHRTAKEKIMLPEAAKIFIKKYFPDNTIQYSKYDKDDKTFDVVLSNGSSIEFDKHGEWMEIECKNNMVPMGLIPLEMMKKIKKEYPDANIAKIEKLNNRWTELDLTNGIKITFDKNMNIIEEN